MFFVDLARSYKDWEGNFARNDSWLPFRLILLLCSLLFANCTGAVRLGKLRVILLDDDHKVEIFGSMIVASRLEFEAREAALAINERAFSVACQAHIYEDRLVAHCLMPF